jgi:hypothetical protein
MPRRQSPRVELVKAIPHGRARRFLAQPLAPEWSGEVYADLEYVRLVVPGLQRTPSSDIGPPV